MFKVYNFFLVSFLLLASIFLRAMECSICRDQLFDRNTRISILPCGHPFHIPCIAQALDVNEHCPICRADCSLNNLGNEYTPAACRLLVGLMFEQPGEAGPAGDRAVEPEAQESEAERPQRGEQGGLVTQDGEFDAVEYYAMGARQGLRLALIWLTQAADVGIVQAQIKLSEILANGLGVDQNIDQAVEWIFRAADTGNATAIIELERFARAGHARAQFIIGDYYEHGRGVDVDHVAAVGWYRMAAERGDQAAQAALTRVEERLRAIEEQLRAVAPDVALDDERDGEDQQEHRGGIICAIQ